MAASLPLVNTGIPVLDRLLLKWQAVLNPILKALGINGAWTAVGRPGTPAFANGWKNVGGAAPVAAFFQDWLGFVHVRGLVGGGTANTTIFTLPSEYAPAVPQTFACDAGGAYAAVGVGANGAVTQTVGGQANLSLNFVLDLRSNP